MSSHRMALAPPDPCESKRLLPFAIAPDGFQALLAVFTLGLRLGIGDEQPEQGAVAMPRRKPRWHQQPARDRRMAAKQLVLKADDGLDASRIALARGAPE